MFRVFHRYNILNFCIGDLCISTIEPVKINVLWDFDPNFFNANKHSFIQISHNHIVMVLTFPNYRRLKKPPKNAVFPQKMRTKSMPAPLLSKILGDSWRRIVRPVRRDLTLWRQLLWRTRRFPCRVNFVTVIRDGSTL